MQATPPPERETRATVIEKIQHSRKDLEEVLLTFNESELNQPGPEGWSVKDHIAHLTSWARGIVALLHQQPRWEAMGLDRKAIEGLDENAINDRIYQLNRDRSLAEVQADFQKTYQELIDAIQGLKDEDLYRTYLYYQPFEGEHDRTWPIVDLIAGNSWGHYEEHIPWIQAIKKS